MHNAQAHAHGAESGLGLSSASHPLSSPGSSGAHVEGGLLRGQLTVLYIAVSISFLLLSFTGARECYPFSML